MNNPRKLDYMTFVLRNRKALRHVDDAGKQFIYDIYKESTERNINVQEIIDYHFELVAIAEFG
jgi:hypothetical protein